MDPRMAAIIHRLLDHQAELISVILSVHGLKQQYTSQSYSEDSIPSQYNEDINEEEKDEESLTAEQQILLDKALGEINPVLRDVDAGVQ